MKHTKINIRSQCVHQSREKRTIKGPDRLHDALAFSAFLHKRKNLTFGFEYRLPCLLISKPIYSGVVFAKALWFHAQYKRCYETENRGAI